MEIVVDKAVFVSIDGNFLKELLGLSPDTEIDLYAAQVAYSIWGFPTVELIFKGNDLPNEFNVNVGEKVKRGLIVVEKTKIKSTFVLSTDQG